MTLAFEVPSIGSGNSTQDPKIKTAVEGLNNVMGASVLLHSAQTSCPTSLAAGTYLLGREPLTGGAKTTEPIPFIYFDDADRTVSGQTLKLRLRAAIVTNATKPGVKFTFGLYPITTAGAANEIIPTAGTIVSGSATEINEPAASSTTTATVTFNAPADGAYTLVVVTSGTSAANAKFSLSAQLSSFSA